MSPAQIEGSEILMGNKDIVKATEKEMMAIRGKDISMIFQDPMTSLNPTMPIGKQQTEAIRHHRKMFCGTYSRSYKGNTKEKTDIRGGRAKPDISK